MEKEAEAPSTAGGETNDACKEAKRELAEEIIRLRKEVQELERAKSQLQEVKTEIQ